MITLKENSKYSRIEIIKSLENQKIQTRLLFAGNILLQPVFDQMRENRTGYRVIGELKNTDKIMCDSFWVGVYPGMSEEMINYMIITISNLIIGKI